jgi:hypothetical protein
VRAVGETVLTRVVQQRHPVVCFETVQLAPHGNRCGESHRGRLGVVLTQGETGVSTTPPAGVR